MTDNMKPLAFPEFRRVLAQVLLTDEANLKPETSFQNDLLVDSIRWLEMALKIESMGVKIPTETLWDIQTVADAYSFYLQGLEA